MCFYASSLYLSCLVQWDDSYSASANNTFWSSGITCHCLTLYYKRLALLTSTRKMEAACSSRMLVSTYRTTWCNKPKDQNLNLIDWVTAGFIVSWTRDEWSSECFFMGNGYLKLDYQLALQSYKLGKGGVDERKFWKWREVWKG
jgi:hypothetical protein